MKKLCSLKDRFSDRRFLCLWFFFHILVLALFLVTVLFAGKILKLDSDLFNMLPKQVSGESVEKAEKKLSETTSRSVFILSCNKDFASAKINAEKVCEELKDSPYFKSVMLYQDFDVLGGFEDFLFENRFNFIDDSLDYTALSEKALEKLYSPFTYSSLNHLDMDPFLLTEWEMEKHLESISSNGTALSPKDNVLAREWNGSWYVMIRGVLSEKGAALATAQNGITQIYSVCSKHEKDGQRFVYSGTGFHSHKSSSAASKEITIISTVSLAAVLILLLFVFRTPVPVFVSLGTIATSLVTAFLLTVCMFHRIHVLTLIFGTTLIGSCIDYSIHYFINWKGNPSVKSGSEVRSILFSGITLSFASTEICFSLLLFAPFELLRQMSVFSMSGIFSTFLSVVCIYPLVKLPEGNAREIFGMKNFAVFSLRNNKMIGRIAIAAMFAFSIVCLCANCKKLGVKNDLSRLYKMEGRVMEDQIESARVLNYAPKGWFMICGSSADDLIVREKNFVADLRGKAKDISIFCTSDFIPSVECQGKSKAVYEELLLSMKNQLLLIGEDEEKAAEILSEWKEKKESFTTFESLPPFLKDLCENTWLGEIDGVWYSVILPSFIPDDLDGKSFAAEYDGHIFYINKVVDISHDLDVLTLMILKFFAVACVIIFVVLKMFYNLKQTLKIISVPLLIVLMVASVYSIAGIRLEFFSITGIILVFGLGLDYVIYMMEVQKKKMKESNCLEAFAVFLSFVTTAISFGSIAFSSFVPVHLMGVSILVGLITAYSCSFFYQRNE